MPDDVPNYSLTVNQAAAVDHLKQEGFEICAEMAFRSWQRGEAFQLDDRVSRKAATRRIIGQANSDIPEPGEEVREYTIEEVVVYKVRALTAKEAVSIIVGSTFRDMFVVKVVSREVTDGPAGYDHECCPAAGNS